VKIADYTGKFVTNVRSEVMWKCPECNGTYNEKRLNKMFQNGCKVTLNNKNTSGFICYSCLKAANKKVKLGKEIVK
jgi:predicted metal-binding protein